MEKRVHSYYHVSTRWTSHYLATTRLLETETALRVLVISSYDALVKCAGEKPDAIQKAEAILRILQSPAFWDNLKQYEASNDPCLFSILMDLLQDQSTP